MPKLVTFGETMVRLSPTAGRLETTDTLDVHVGGAESNVAAAAAQLGIDATWISKLPDSPLGRRVAAELRQYGVDPAVIWNDSGRQGLYFLEPGMEPRETEVVYDRAHSPITTATPDELPVGQIQEADVFFTCGITPALSKSLAQTTASLLRAAREAETTTAFDLNYRSKLWTPEEARTSLEEVIGTVDILVVAERDAETVFGRDGSPVDVVAGLAAEYEPETLILTRRDAGALAFHDGTVHEQAAFDATSAHPVGTGDAFVGGYLARRLQGDNIPDALESGAAIAALKRGIPGDMVATTPQEVERIVSEDATGISR